MDFWKAFITGAEKQVPDADIVHDKFHIEKYLHEAVDKVRRREHKNLKTQKDSNISRNKISLAEVQKEFHKG